MLLVTTDGRTIEVDDQAQINRLISKGAREATKKEIDSYNLRVDQAIQRAKNPDAGSNSVYYQTVKSSPDGYGMSRDILKRELFKLGIKLDEFYHEQKIGLLYSYPYGIEQMRTDVRLLYTMFESDQIPEDWPEYLKAADEVIVPSKWCAEVFAKSGINATVVPLGYDDEVFNFIDRKIPVENKKPFTFIHYGSFDYRKGWQEVFEAFNEEFTKNEPVKIIMKTVQEKLPVPIMKDQYPNIEVITGNLPDGELANLLGRANCMVYPSRGEGFGITPLEAMATGLPAIVPNAHGISEYFNSKYMMEVKVSGPSPGYYLRFRDQDVGEMVICDKKHLRKQMRYAVNHQKEMYELGKLASQYAKRYTYKQTAEGLAHIVNKWRKADVPKRQDSKFLKVERL